jgi:hypothetical protein
MKDTFYWKLWGHMKDTVYWKISQVRKLFLRIIESAERIRGNDEIIRKAESFLRLAELCIQNVGGRFEE